VKILTTLSRPDEGSAEVAGVDVLRHPGRVRRLIGAVSQNSGADPQATGRENLLLAGRVHGLAGAQLRERIGELLARFNLAEAANRTVRTYSGGMRRKLDVALGLVHAPQVLFLDEPTTGLDPEARAEMWAEVSALARDDRLSVLLTTHYLEEADALASRLAIVDRGRVVTEGSPDQLKGELRGDTVSVELDPAVALDAVPGAAEALRALPAVREVTVDGRTLRARADAGAQAVPAVLAVLDQARVTVAAVTVARPSLDDVYLRHTGRAYSAAAATTTTEPGRGPEGAHR
jgi:ABC-2 type transport system ATP-binding protein